MHAECVEHVAGVGEHVHQMRDRLTLIAADIRHTGLQQRFSDGEDALAANSSPSPSLRSCTSRANKRSAMSASEAGIHRNRVKPADLIFMKPSPPSCNGANASDGGIAQPAPFPLIGRGAIPANGDWKGRRTPKRQLVRGFLYI